MFVCSIIIIAKIFNTSSNLKSHGSGLRTIAKNRSIKNKQLLYILFSTNCLFICMVSPLVFLNAFKLIEEDTVMSTMAYILAYGNHG